MAGTSSIVSAVAKRLEGKVALITGGASGIGACTAKLFANHGAKVAIADVQDELGHSVAADIGNASATFIHCDVSNEDLVRNAVDTTVSKFGKLDIMFNNAGIPGNPNPRIVDTDTAEFERVMRVNLTGVFLGMKHAARVMIPARSGGSIISTSSMASGMGGAALHAYTCSKFGVVGLTKNLAVELGHYGIRVNCLSPFVMATRLAMDYTGLGEAELEKMSGLNANLKGDVLKVEDVANAALFLASNDGKYVSGQNLFIDGGFSITNNAMRVFEYPQES